MKSSKTTFALFFGNRGFFPAQLIEAARKELSGTLKRLGHKTLMMPEDATRHGAIETVEEGEKFAAFLAKNRGKFGGVIVCLPNFGDETGAVAALEDAGVPLLVQAYPDELDKMSNDLRRDAFCGKFSIMDVFVQYGLPFTALPPHTTTPSSPDFAENIDYFDRLCRVVGAMKRMRVGALGARTTPFKTVRIDELTLQKHGVTVETFDLADVFARMRALKKSDPALKDKIKELKNYTTWDGVPAEAIENLARLAVTIDAIVAEQKLDAYAIRCWLELQQQWGISPCVVAGLTGSHGVPGACEVDIGNAVTMAALRRASGEPATLLDWNNNYGDARNKCILFHCGPAPREWMTAEGRVTDHDILANATGPGCGYGCNQGRLRPLPFTFGSLLTRDGEMEFYLGEARFTDDPIPEDFFGVAGVAEFADLQSTLRTIGYAGHRHHVSVAPGHVAAPTREAFERYLGFRVTAV